MKPDEELFVLKLGSKSLWVGVGAKATSQQSLVDIHTASMVWGFKARLCILLGVWHLMNLPHWQVSIL
jgi:hypothetical protein